MPVKDGFQKYVPWVLISQKRPRNPASGPGVLATARCGSLATGCLRACPPGALGTLQEGARCSAPPRIPHQQNSSSLSMPGAKDQKNTGGGSGPGGLLPTPRLLLILSNIPTIPDACAPFTNTFKLLEGRACVFLTQIPPEVLFGVRHIADVQCTLADLSFMGLASNFLLWTFQRCTQAGSDQPIPELRPLSTLPSLYLFSPPPPPPCILF